MSLFSNIVSPNADIAALLAQQNLANRGTGGGSYSGAGIEDTLNLYAGQQNLAEQAAVRSEPRERRAALFQMAMEQDMARDKMRLDREALEHAAALQEKALLKAKLLDLRMASAGEGEKQQIANEMAEHDKYLADLNDKRNAADALFAKNNESSQLKLGQRLNELRRGKELQDARLGQFRSAFDSTGEGEARRKGVLDNTLSNWMTNPAKGGEAQYGALSGLFGQPGALPGNVQYLTGRAAEGVWNWFTDDPVADTAIVQAFGSNPAVLDAAARWGGSKGLASLIRGTDKGVFGSAMDPSRDKYAAQFAVNIMSDSVVSALSALGTGMNRDAAEKSAQSLLLELHNLARSGNTDVTKATTTIAPLVRELAKNAYGNEENAGEVVNVLKHAFQQMAQRESVYGAEALKTPGSIGVEAVKNASIAYALSQASPMLHALKAATRGQFLDDDAYNMVMGATEQVKEKGGDYRLAGLDVDASKEFLQVLGEPTVAAIREGKAAGKARVATEEELKAKEVALQRKKAGTTKSIPGREAATRKAEQDVLLRQLDALSKMSR